MRGITPELNKGCHVQVHGSGGTTRIGIVRFIGHIHHKEGTYYGIELTDGSIGNNDGSIGNTRYFEMESEGEPSRWKSKKTKRGIFVRRYKIRKILRTPRKAIKTSFSTQKLRSPQPQRKTPRSPSSDCPKRPRSHSPARRPSRLRRLRKRLCTICGIDLNFLQPLADRILDHVLLGGYQQSQDGNGLEHMQVTHVLNCARELPNCFPEVLTYLKLNFLDNNEQDIMSYFEDAFEFLDGCWEDNGVCLVHCQQGKSRSVSIVAAYLIARRGLSFNVAIERIKAIRPVVKVNKNFAEQLQLFERAAKRWRRNPHPQTKRLYGLQSFKQVKYKNKRRASHAPPVRRTLINQQLVKPKRKSISATPARKSQLSLHLEEKDVKKSVSSVNWGNLDIVEGLSIEPARSSGNLPSKRMNGKIVEEKDLNPSNNPGDSGAQRRTKFKRTRALSSPRTGEIKPKKVFTGYSGIWAQVDLHEAEKKNQELKLGNQNHDEPTDADTVAYSPRVHTRGRTRTRISESPRNELRTAERGNDSVTEGALTSGTTIDLPQSQQAMRRLRNTTEFFTPSKSKAYSHIRSKTDIFL